MPESTDRVRTALPIPDQEYAGLISYDAKSSDAKFPPITALRPPDYDRLGLRDSIRELERREVSVIGGPSDEAAGKSSGGGAWSGSRATFRIALDRCDTWEVEGTGQFAFKAKMPSLSGKPRYPFLVYGVADFRRMSTWPP